MEVRRKRDLGVNASKTKLMVVEGEGELNSA